MFSVSGSIALSLATVGLSSSVALKVLEPIMIFILPSTASLVTRTLRLIGSEASAVWTGALLSHDANASSRPAVAERINRDGFMAIAVASVVLLQVVAKEGRELVEGDEVHPVVQVHVASTLNKQQFLGPGGTLVRVLADAFYVWRCPRPDPRPPRFTANLAPRPGRPTLES